MFQATAQQILTALTKGHPGEALDIIQRMTACNDVQAMDLVMRMYVRPCRDCLKRRLVSLSGPRVRGKVRSIQGTEEKPSCMLTGEDLNIEIIQDIQKQVEVDYPELDITVDREEYLTAIIDIAAGAIAEHRSALAVQLDSLEEKDQEIEKLKHTQSEMVFKVVYDILLAEKERSDEVAEERINVLHQQNEEIRGLHAQVKRLQDAAAAIVPREVYDDLLAKHEELTKALRAGRGIKG